MNSAARKSFAMPGPLAWTLWALLLVTDYAHAWLAPLGDATWALFFIGGFYLRAGGVFLIFFATKTLADFASIAWAGVDAACITPGYAMLLPAMAALWWGGVGLRRFDEAPALRRLAALAALASVSTLAAFALTNFGYYWYAPGNLPPLAYIGAVWRYGIDYLAGVAFYVGIAAAAHIAWTARRRPASAD